MKSLLAMALLLLSACAARPAVSGEPPSGTWSGDYEVGSERREPISVDLQWDGTNLRGAVHSGPRALPLTKGSFKPETGDISIEFDAEGNRGQIVHYTVEGRVSGNTMTGAWSHDGQHGDFRVTKQ